MKDSGKDLVLAFNVVEAQLYITQVLLPQWQWCLFKGHKTKIMCQGKIRNFFLITNHMIYFGSSPLSCVKILQ